MSKIVLPYDSIFQAYEGTDPAQYTELSGSNFNKPSNQLLANIKKIQSDINSGKAGGAVEFVAKAPDDANMEENTWYVTVE